jgi:hypothetical protein
MASMPFNFWANNIIACFSDIGVAIDIGVVSKPWLSAERIYEMSVV